MSVLLEYGWRVHAKEDKEFLKARILSYAEREEKDESDSNTTEFRIIGKVIAIGYPEGIGSRRRL